MKIMMNSRINKGITYQTEIGVIDARLYEEGTRMKGKCPYCGKPVSHGVLNGKRKPHCGCEKEYFIFNKKAEDSKVFHELCLVYRNALNGIFDKVSGEFTSEWNDFTEHVEYEYYVVYEEGDD